MDLLDRYVNEVGKQLPRKNRADIENEIRSTLEDMLADRSERTGQPVDEAMLKELLVEYGAPDKVAATYVPERYLIGPRLFPLFWMVIRIVFAVLTALAVIGLGIRLGMTPGPVQAATVAAGRAVLEYIQGLIIALGNIVLVFAILERVLPESQQKAMDPGEGEAWNPDQLMQEPTGDEVRPWEPVVAILFTVAGLVIFNLYPQVVGFYVRAGQPAFFPLLSVAFFRYMPALNLLWALGIGLQLMLWREGRYTTTTRWFSIILKAGSVALAAAMLTGPSLIGITTGQIVASGMPADSAGTLLEMLNVAVRIALIVSIAAGSFDIIKDLYRLIINPSRRKPVVA